MILKEIYFYLWHCICRNLKNMEFKMNINSDVNKNIDLISGLKSDEQNTSILNTLFSVNFENDTTLELNNEEEFVFLIFQKYLSF